MSDAISRCAQCGAKLGELHRHTCRRCWGLVLPGECGLVGGALRHRLVRALGHFDEVEDETLVRDVETVVRLIGPPSGHTFLLLLRRLETMQDAERRLAKVLSGRDAELAKARSELEKARAELSEERAREFAESEERRGLR